MSYAFHGGTKLGGSMIYGSGLRRDDDVNSIPNGAKLAPYAQFNLTASQHLAGPNLDIRFDVINALDHNMKSATGPASVSARRNMARVAGSSSACRRRSRL